MDEKMNSPVLKRERLVEIIKCDGCRKFNIIASDPGRSNVREEQCHFCFKGLDRKNKVGDSHMPQEFPDWSFAISGTTPKGFPYIQPYMTTLCPNCMKDVLIPYHKGRFLYDKCPECHGTGHIAPPAPTSAPVQATTPAPAAAPEEPAIEFVLKVPSHLVRPFKDYVFENDVTKPEVAVRALELLLKPAKAN